MLTCVDMSVSDYDRQESSECVNCVLHIDVIFILAQVPKWLQETSEKRCSSRKIVIPAVSCRFILPNKGGWLPKGLPRLGSAAWSCLRHPAFVWRKFSGFAGREVSGSYSRMRGSCFRKGCKLSQEQHVHVCCIKCNVCNDMCTRA